jgi:hypothetical protein
MIVITVAVVFWFVPSVSFSHFIPSVFYDNVVFYWYIPWMLGYLYRYVQAILFVSFCGQTKVHFDVVVTCNGMRDVCSPNSYSSTSTLCRSEPTRYAIEMHWEYVFHFCSRL